MASSSFTATHAELCPTEDAVEALLGYFVDPVLPSRHCGTKELLPLSFQQSVAKQLHAVVLLYNYYQRKQRPEAEFLDFQSFCKLAVILRPALMAHMKYMQLNYSDELINLENQFSVLERAIMDACSICYALDASADVPNFEGWPISKVSVLLIDSEKKCLLLLNSLAVEEWSLIEIAIDDSNLNSSSRIKSKRTDTSQRTCKMSLFDNQNADDTAFQQLAFSSIEELTGLNQSELRILERHIVYSLSKEKTAACFYIIQCTDSTDQRIQIPIRDAIESLQGPLFKRTSGSWLVSPIVKYYHLLPYARIMSGWLTRVGESGGSYKISGLADPTGKEEGNDGCKQSSISVSSIGSQRMDVDDSVVVAIPKSGDSSQAPSSTIKVYHRRRKTSGGFGVNASSIGYVNTMRKDVDNSVVTSSKKEYGTKNFNSEVTKYKRRTGRMAPIFGDVDPPIGHSNALGKEKTADVTKSYDDTESRSEEVAGNCNLGAIMSDQMSLEDLQTTLASEERETVLRMLHKKREQLCDQKNDLEAEIGSCDEKILKIFEGNEDSLAIKLEAIMECCDDACFEDQAQIEAEIRKFTEEHSLQSTKRKSLLNAAFPCDLNVRNTHESQD